MAQVNMLHQIGNELNVVHYYNGDLSNKVAWLSVSYGGIILFRATQQNGAVELLENINIIKVTLQAELLDLPEGTYQYVLQVKDTIYQDIAVAQYGTITMYSDFRFGDVSSGDYTSLDSTTGQLRLLGDATIYDDLRIDGLSTRPGVTQPTDETGWRGNSAFYSRNFVHTQADEVQFHVQLAHGWVEGGYFAPHVHFSPWATNTGVAAVKFVFQFYWQNVNEVFPDSVIQYEVTDTWTDDKQWAHLIASNPSPLTATGKKISSVLVGRLYRDNTVENNYQNKVSLLYVDFHMNVNSLGSSQTFIKDW